LPISQIAFENYLKKQKTVFALSLFFYSNIFAQTNEENNATTEEATTLSIITVKASKDVTQKSSLIDGKKSQALQHLQTQILNFHKIREVRLKVER
jgi:hypothetical protein